MAAVTVTLTEAQARAINGALAYCTAGDPEDGGMSPGALGQRQFRTAVEARAVLQRAMQGEGGQAVTGDLRERLALAIHEVVCADGPCVPHQNDWLAVADTALAAVDQQRQETPA